MSTAHTPGPWTLQRNVANYRSGAKSLQARGAADELIATFPGCERDSANARLIAGAPKLLVALRNLITSAKTQHNLDEAIGWAEAAVAEATGEVA